MSRLASFVCLGIFPFLCEFLWGFTLNDHRKGSTGFRDSVLPLSIPIVRQDASLLKMTAEPVQGPAIATQVLYQKVVRPFKNLPDLLFLGYLVDYLESYFELPTGLPMVYESLPGNEEVRSILAWDSPLSSSSEATRMEVEVVGIYTDRKEGGSSSEPSIPKMAMVVVRKAKPSKGSLPPMMANLFEDSEKKIIRALDRGLEDFIAGKIKFANEQPKTPRNVKTAEEAIEAELMDSIPQRKKPKLEAKDVVFDAYATEDKGGKKAEKVQNGTEARSTAVRRGAGAASMNIEKNEPKNSSSKSVAIDFEVGAVKKKVAGDKLPKPLEDFAVAAARRVKEKKERQVQKTQEDYAVAAAQKVVAAHISKGTVEKTKMSRPESAAPMDTDMDMTSEFKIPDYMGGKRAFRTTISLPRDRTKKKALKNTSLLKTVGHDGASSPQLTSSPPKPSERGMTKGEVSSELLKKTDKPVPSQQEIEKEVIKAAQEVMDEFSAGGETTPEQLLRDILKFGEEREKENEPGEGFVSAAFDKAKNLMREQYQKQKANDVRELGFREPEIIDDIRPEIDEGLSAEEELKRMFEAGQRIADSRIIQSEIAQSELARKDTTNEDIDALIAKDKTISSYARLLDDQLIALEVAINKSPGEELDGQQKYPLFDIMSGPELYNPNVNRDAINYPGALPGTKAMDVSKELGEAIRQAEFAVKVLSEVRTVGSDAVGGTTKYIYGKQELTETQMQQLEMVAIEAIEIGLIRDPIKLADESSRLQMLLDELLGQPFERFRAVAENYKDLLLSDNFVDLLKIRLKKMAERDLEALRRDDDSLRETHEREREILGKLVAYAQLLLKETRALGAELEAQQLEVIRSICQVAMDPKHQTEEETAIALSDAVRDMRPLLDDSFVAYLKFAVAEEEARLARVGLVDDPEHNQWLFVLKIVQQGVYAEISKSINRYIDHIRYILRMETPRERRMLVSKLIDAMPTMDVRPFVKVVDNIVSALGESARGEFDEGASLGEMTNQLLQLHRDVRELLPPERIAEKSRDADEWAARQKERLLEARKIGKQRLKAANDVADRQDEIDAVARRGETERFD